MDYSVYFQYTINNLEMLYNIRIDIELIKY